MKTLHPYNLAVFRAAQGLTQKEACKLLGVCIKSWRHYETVGTCPALWMYACYGHGLWESRKP